MPPPARSHRSRVPLVSGHASVPTIVSNKPPPMHSGNEGGRSPKTSLSVPVWLSLPRNLPFGPFGSAAMVLLAAILVVVGLVHRGLIKFGHAGKALTGSTKSFCKRLKHGAALYHSA